MYRKLRIITSLAFIPFMLIRSYSLEKVDTCEPAVSAKSAVVICADSAEVIFKKDENTLLPMASTTKIMTALLTLEAFESFNREVRISDEMVKVEGSSMGLRSGDVVSLYALSQGMLLSSGNDAANSAAIAVSGSMEKFVGLMNEKAHQIGLRNTVFVTPSGLDADSHHSTAYDMALLGAYAMENQHFSDIASRRSMKVSFIQPQKTCTYANHNKLLKLYDGCIGIKTGFTKSAGRCLVSCAERNGIRLVGVTLNASDDWRDHQKMLDYSFSQVERCVFDDTGFNLEIPLVGASKDKVLVQSDASNICALRKDDTYRVKRLIKLQRFLYAPLKKGQIVGEIIYLLDDKELIKNPIKCADDVESLKKNGMFAGILKKFKWFNKRKE